MDASCRSKNGISKMQDAKLFLLLGKYQNQKMLIFSRFQVSVKKYEEGK